MQSLAEAMGGSDRRVCSDSKMKGEMKGEEQSIVAVGAHCNSSTYHFTCSKEGGSGRDTLTGARLTVQGEG